MSAIGVSTSCPKAFDVALRVRSQLDEDGELALRSFGQIRELLVASPGYLHKRGRPALPSDLAQHACVPQLAHECAQL